MLSYAFRVLRDQGYKEIATENFDNTAELFGAILEKGIAIQIKRGLGKEYIEKSDTISSLHGKINITQSIKNQTIIKKQMVCTFDDFSVNTYMNRIIKTTVELLLRFDISKSRKKNLKKLMVYFVEVNSINLYTVNWNFQYKKNNQTYQMLISICYLIAKGLLQTNSEGNTKLMDFIDEQNMHRLYEKFILEYYRKEFPEITTNASQVSWQLDDNFSYMLPTMKTDIMLTYKGKTLIIDAKYYGKTMQVNFDKHTIHSNNMYQIFTYVKNKNIEIKNKEEVFGMLLYAKTDEQLQPDVVYHMSGNKISVKTLDLNLKFNEISEQLNTIIKEHFQIHKNL